MEQEYTKAVIYCRVSSEKQVKEGNGLDSQEHRCREYAKSLGLEVEQVFRDEGISGGLFDRPAMQSLINYLDKNWQTKYCVIFDDLKRFARDVEVHIKLKAELKGRDAKLRCLNYNFDDSAEGEFVETIFAAQNQLERKQNRRQVCQKMKARIERGYWCFTQPSGYEFKKDKEHGKILVPIRSISNIIAKGLIDYAENRLLGQVDLQRFFESQNLHKLIGSKKMYLQFVKRLLTESLYAGIVEYPEWGISKRKGHHKAIISEEVYDKIQRKLMRPERIPRETDSLEFPLRRNIDCEFCGKTMTGSSSHSKNADKYYPHYTCNNKDCIANPKNITASKVEDDYAEMLGHITVGEEVLEMIKIVTTRLWLEKVKGRSTSSAIAEAEIKEIEKQINEFIDLIPTTKSESIRARYEAKVESLDQRIKELQSSLENKKEPNFKEALNLTLRLLGTPAETWKSVSLEKKNLVHKLIFTENPKYSFLRGFGTIKLSLPFYIKDYVTGQNDVLVDPKGLEPLASSMPWRRSSQLS